MKEQWIKRPGFALFVVFLAFSFVSKRAISQYKVRADVKATKASTILEIEVSGSVGGKGVTVYDLDWARLKWKLNEVDVTGALVLIIGTPGVKVEVLKGAALLRVTLGFDLTMFAHFLGGAPAVGAKSQVVDERGCLVGGHLEHPGQVRLFFVDNYELFNAEVAGNPCRRTYVFRVFGANENNSAAG